MRIAVALTGLAMLFAAAPRRDAWTILGPGGGGAQFFPSVSPHDPKLVFVACDMTGSYVSQDGGDTWRMFNLRSVSRLFAFDPVNPNTVYAATSSLWRSRDRGAAWELLWPEPARVTGSNMRNDHADERFVVDGKPARRVTAFAIHPQRPQMLYLTVQDGPEFELLTSSDGGKTWTSSGAAPSFTRKLFVNGSGVVHAIAQDAVYIGSPGSWKQGAPLAKIDDASAGWGANGELTVYAVAGPNGYVSDDSGRSWRDFKLTGEGTTMRAVATSLHHPATAYVSYGRLNGKFFGVAKTTDFGKTWDYVWRDARDEPAKNMTYGWIAERFGSGWASNPLSLGVSPADPKIAFGTDFGRTVRTTDGGASWKTVYTRKEGSGWVSTGLDVTTAYSVHFDPFDKRRIFISYTDIGAFRSEDGGKTWVGSTEGIERAWTNTTYDLAFDPEVKGRVWGVFSGTHDLPRPKMWRTNAPSSYRGGVGISSDGGRTWRMLKNAGIPETAPTHVLIDPSSPRDSRTLYVAAFGRGVYKSTDGGSTWTLKNRGLPGQEPFAWRFARAKTGDLYLVIARRTEDGAIGSPGDGGLFRSSDGAETWTPVPLPEGVNGPNGLAIDPENPRRMYLATWGRRTSDANDGGGVFVSEDGGKSWTPSLTRDRHVYDVTIDPKAPATLYACGFESSAWRSKDRGKTWARLRGYNFKWGHRVIPDPNDSSRVYITTFGGSVWHGPAAGDPKAPEDLDAPWLQRILEPARSR
jgi:photosystem II stability/assembly factor-like uncharacterized protein